MIFRDCLNFIISHPHHLNAVIRDVASSSLRNPPPITIKDLPIIITLLRRLGLCHWAIPFIFASNFLPIHHLTPISLFIPIRWRLCLYRYSFSSCPIISVCRCPLLCPNALCQKDRTKLMR